MLTMMHLAGDNGNSKRQRDKPKHNNKSDHIIFSQLIRKRLCCGLKSEVDLIFKIDLQFVDTFTKGCIL